MSIYLTSGSSVKIANETDLSVSSTLPVGNYIVQLTPSGEFYLKSIDRFERPPKYYGDVESKAARIVETYNSRAKSTGVLLSGIPGSGKTLLAREVCMRCADAGISTVIINEPHNGDKFSSFIASIDMDCVIFFDEFEKVYDAEDQEAVLTVFDGTYTQKKLFLVTVNDVKNLVSPFISRPGRLYYHFRYDGVDREFMVQYVNDHVANVEHRQGLIQLLGNLFVGASFDSMSSLVEEMNRYNEPAPEVMKFMNVQPTSRLTPKFRIESDKFKIVEVTRSEVNDLFTDTHYGIKVRCIGGDDNSETVSDWLYIDVRTHMKSFDKDTGVAYFEYASDDHGIFRIEAWQEVDRVFNVMDAF